MEKWTGNLVLPGEVCFGEIELAEGLIQRITRKDLPQPGVILILPGFIDLHFHGLGTFGTGGLAALQGIAKFAPKTGTTGVCPTLAPYRWDKMLSFVRHGARLAKQEPAGARILGTHLEGPFIAPEAKGGMNLEYLRSASVEEFEELWHAGEGTLRLLTISPELPGAMEVIRRAAGKNVQVSVGHTHCTLKQFQEAVSAGAGQVCHLFDTFEGRNVVGGVCQPSLTDAILLEERVFVEIIADGHHVPPLLIELARRCAGSQRIIAITDCMQGTGLPDAVYQEEDGRDYRLTNGDVCRLMDETKGIVGSCLTMDQAFRNLTGKFGFAIPEASRMLSGNPAQALKLEQQIGSLQEGWQADIVLLSPETYQVQQTLVAGKIAYAAR
ncbi:MAG: amidohydrolase family protein [Lentisphaeria bacterium]